jgi:hypothetical protein
MSIEGCPKTKPNGGPGATVNKETGGGKRSVSGNRWGRPDNDRWLHGAAGQHNTNQSLQGSQVRWSARVGAILAARFLNSHHDSPGCCSLGIDTAASRCLPSSSVSPIIRGTYSATVARDRPPHE